MWDFIEPLADPASWAARIDRAGDVHLAPVDALERSGRTIIDRQRQEPPPCKEHSSPAPTALSR